MSTENPFKSVKFDEAQVCASDVIREKASALLREIDLVLLDSRERSLAKTKLEECVMWANRSIAVAGTRVEYRIGGAVRAGDSD